MDDVCVNRRPPSTVLFLLHVAWCSNGPEGAAAAHCSVPAGPGPTSAGARHRYFRKDDSVLGARPKTDIL